MDVPSRQAAAVQLGPTKGARPTVYLSDAARELNPRLRQDLSEFIERTLRSRAEMIEPRRSSKLRNAFAAFEFAPGTLPHQALLLVRKARSWFFQSLMPAKNQRAERKNRKALRKAALMEKRRERHTVKRDVRSLRGARGRFG